MTTRYKTGSIVICDDVRMEVGGKESLLGVYRGVIVLQEFPTTLQKLCFRIPLFGFERIDGVFNLDISDPNRKRLVEMRGELSIEIADPGFEAVFGIAVVNPTFRVPGVYKIKFVVGEGKPREVGRFLVRQAQIGDPTYVQKDV
jgi:hypothetical protein